MNTKNLYYFLVVAEELNMTRAAERLYISQQALSEQIRKLEDELKAELFTRGHSLSLTYAGRHMVDTATQMLSLERQIKNRIVDIPDDRSGELVLGMSYTRGRLILPRVLPILEREYPNVNIRVEIKPTNLLEKYLLNGAIDIALGFNENFNSAKIEKACISEEVLYLAVHHRRMISMFGENAPKMIQEMKKSVDLTLFAAQPFLLIRRGNYLRDIENQIFKKYEINYKMKFEESFADILMLLAGQDMGVTFLPQMIMAMQPQYFDYAGENTLHAFPFTDLEHNIRVVAAYHSDRYIPRVSRALISILREECQNAVEAFTKRSQMDAADTAVCLS